MQEGELETNAWGVFFGGSTVCSPPPLLPLSQIWAYTETDSMPGLPMNSLNSIEGPLSAPGVMGCFRSLGKPVEARGRFISPLQGVQWGRGHWAQVLVLAGT